jgi:hypothetical protein
LVHPAEPSEDLLAAGAHRREDGLWVYRTVRARELFDTVTRSTYDHADPGVFFVDRANAENNLGYCEQLESTNPCGEQPLPDYGCCCLGSIDLTRFVQDPFTPAARVDGEGLAQAMAAKAVSSVEVTQHLLGRAQTHAHLGSFLHLDAEAALNAARPGSAAPAVLTFETEEAEGHECFEELTVDFHRIKGLHEDELRAAMKANETHARRMQWGSYFSGAASSLYGAASSAASSVYGAASSAASSAYGAVSSAASAVASGGAWGDSRTYSYTMMNWNYDANSGTPASASVPLVGSSV